MIVAEGKWSLTSGHQLIYTVRRSKRLEGRQRLNLRTELIEARANALVFLLAAQGKDNNYQFKRLELKGKWRTDKYNRLQFLVKKLNNRFDTLTFQGAWGLKRNTLVYTCKQESIKTKKKITRTLRFKGFWEINQRNRLTYILDAKNQSIFEFKAYLETPNLIGKQGVIKYRVGIGARTSKAFKEKVISLYGVWKLERKTGVSLVIDYADRKAKAIKFGAFVRIKPKGKLELNLKTRAGKDLGISLTFSQRFLKTNAEWFLKLIREAKGPGFKIGINIPW